MTITREGVLSPAQLAERVRRLTQRPAEWIARVRLDAEGRWYEQIRTGENYEIWLISWLPGQSTGFHDHGESAGAFGVVWGDLDEYQPSASVRRASPGMVRSFGPRYVHDVRNTSESSVAVSVHAYSPPLSEMTRYSLTPGGLVTAGIEGEADW
jgi:predicted metal-dependent enzyme (double-stranded beta helix superfamily)